MSVNLNMISLTNAYPDIVFKKICLYLRAKDYGSLSLTCKEFGESSKKYFEEYPKHFDKFKKMILINSVMHATKEEIPDLLTSYFKNNNTVGLKILIESGRLKKDRRYSILVRSLLDAIKNSIDFRSAFIKAAEYGHQGNVKALMDSKRFAEISAADLGSAFIKAANIEAARRGRSKSTVKALMDSERFAEISTADFRSAFIKAAEHGHQGNVKALMDSERFAEISTADFRSAFIEAVGEVSQSIAKALMDSERFAEISTADFRSAFDTLERIEWRGIIEAFMISERFAEISTDDCRLAFIKAARVDTKML